MPHLELASTLSSTSVISCIAGSAITLLTFLGQIMVFVIVARDTRLRTPNNYFIISLASADVLISLFAMPAWTVFSTLGYLPFSSILCDIWHMFDYSLCSVSIFTVMLISLDRYLSLKYPLTYRVKRTSWKVKVALAAIWLISFIISIIFVGVTQKIYGPDNRQGDCQIYYLSNSLPLALVACVVLLWGPVIATAVIYILVYQIVQNAGKMETIDAKATHPENCENNKTPCRQEFSPTAKDMDKSNKNITEAIAEEPDSKSNRSSKYKVNMKSRNGNIRRISSGHSGEDKSGKALRTIALLLLVFSICWMPISVFFIMTSLMPNSISPVWMILTYWLGYINSFLNPICYAIGNPYFRQTLLKMCCGKCCEKYNITHHVASDHKGDFVSIQLASLQQPPRNTV